ncbi:hypothetical protein VTH06DRAFT_8511 [Thermothelomyces fergusii]
MDTRIVGTARSWDKEHCIGASEAGGRVGAPRTAKRFRSIAVAIRCIDVSVFVGLLHSPFWGTEKSFVTTPGYVAVLRADGVWMAEYQGNKSVF